jgi:hypothetical protein
LRLAKQLKKAEGRRQRAEGRRGFSLPPERERLKELQWGIVILAPFGRQKARAFGKKIYPSALCPLPSAFCLSCKKQF